MKSERQIEARLKREVEKRKGLCVKWTAPGTAGVPDRIVIWPDGRIHFVELKAEGKRENLSAVQKVFRKKLLDRACHYFVLASYEDIEKYMKEESNGVYTP